MLAQGLTVGQRGIADLFVPARERQLRGEVGSDHYRFLKITTLRFPKGLRIGAPRTVQPAKVRLRSFYNLAWSNAGAGVGPPRKGLDSRIGWRLSAIRVSASICGYGQPRWPGPITNDNVRSFAIDSVSVIKISL